MLKNRSLLYRTRLLSTIFLFVLFSLRSGSLSGQISDDTKISLEWKVGYSDLKDQNPGHYYDAHVPGATLYDYMLAERKSPFYYGNNVQAYGIFENKYWRYKSTFAKPSLNNDQSLFFISKGIDYEFEIIINGTSILYQEGMFTPVQLMLDPYLKENNTLEILIYPIPKDTSQIPGRAEASKSVKPPVPYGWDWHPRLVPVGIWDYTMLEVRPDTRITMDDMNYVVKDGYATAIIDYAFDVHAFEGKIFDWQVTDNKGRMIIEKKGKVEQMHTVLNARIDDVNLWWPHDQGIPYLYQSTLSIYNNSGKIIDEVHHKIGFRDTKLVMNTGAWAGSKYMPNTRNVPPFTLQINGRRIFAKGSNWVHPEVFYGIIDKDRYLEQLLLARKAHFNILRSWGGGIINKEVFFDICDSLGIMVWQEFPLACNLYPDDSHYLKILDQEARSIIHRVKQHPSLAMWSGGNELFNNWSKMTDQSLPLRLLNSLCYQLDPHTPFIMTSPVMGVGHGHYLFYDPLTGEDVFQLMRRAHNTAYTEFGVPGMASMEILKKIIPENELFPPEPGTSWEIHHAYKAWRRDSWLEPKTLEKYFGKADDLEELIRESQLLQVVGYKCIFENARRQKPYCSMAINWCYNEPWPTAVNNSLISYPNVLKPAYYAVAASCRPLLANASFDKFVWKPGEELSISCSVLNDSYKSVDRGKVNVYILMDGKRRKLMTWDYPELEANKNFEGPVIRYSLPAGLRRQVFKILLEVENKEDLNSEYFLMYDSGRKGEKIELGSYF